MGELPFDHPEIKEVIDTTLNVLVAESDRGAVLVAAELINNTLGQFLQDIFPPEFKSSILLNYPGSLSTLSARADAMYAFRLVGKDIHRVMTLFRRVRNEAAHSSSDFSLEGQADRLQEAYNELVKPWASIDHLATKLIVEKLFQWVNADGDGTWREIYKQGIFSGPDEVLKEMVKRQEKQLERHKPKFRLAVAVSLLCAFIVYHKKELLTALGDSGLLIQVFQQNDRQMKD